MLWLENVWSRGRIRGAEHRTYPNIILYKMNQVSLRGRIRMPSIWRIRIPSFTKLAEFRLRILLQNRSSFGSKYLDTNYDLIIMNKKCLIERENKRSWVLDDFKYNSLQNRSNFGFEYSRLTWTWRYLKVWMVVKEIICN